MRRRSGPCALACLTLLAACGRRAGSGTAGDASKGPPEGFSHYEDKYFALDYPSDFKVTGTPPNAPAHMTPSFFVEPKAPVRGSTFGQLTFAPDPMYPDMLLSDAVTTAAKGIVSDGGRVLGGIRRLAVKNGTCLGYVQSGPLRKCPETAGFKTPSGRCYDAELAAFCESPARRHFMLGGTLGSIPTPDRLTAEAAAFGKTHERILSTLEFK